MVTYLKDAKTCSPPNRDKECAIDPGIRKFLTVYSPQGRVDILGTNTNSTLDKLLRRNDRAQQRLGRHSDYYSAKKDLGRTRRIKKRLRHRMARLKRRYRDAELRATNTIKDLHYKAAHFLCQNYETILYPHFNAHSIATGTLNRKVKRRLNMLSFFKFSTRLKHTCTFYATTLQRGSEAYTSKQCGGCGVLNDKLGGSETFKCKGCGLHADRDVHAARNIFLRHLC